MWTTGARAGAVDALERPPLLRDLKTHGRSYRAAAPDLLYINHANCARWLCLTQIHALLDAVAGAADQRERKGNDRHDLQLLISQINRHPSPAGGQLQGKNARTRHGEMAFSANQWLPGTE